ncbi:MAG: 50S rRNA methyltransferase [Bacteroides sp. SM23_62_1]|nr:MAG: 50S rRNA methyltransferase [Bacteroides sp. SM23_62_1]
MRITLLYTGKTKKDFVKEGIQTYSERISRYIPFKIVEIPDPKYAGKQSEAVMKEKEAELILKYLSKDDLVVILDARGRMISSEQFAEYIEEKAVSSTRHLIFIIGGAYGFNDRIYNRADDIISLSKMTFSHQITRIVFLEQLYRAFSIIRGEPYHHG